MYVLCSPCILEPAIRAEGITKQSDLELFARAQERCKTFAVDMVPLPCPETLYLGAKRQPGTFLERLNTPAFSSLMDRLEEDVKEIIRSRGPPLCILGANSSPTCGVTTTYYGSTEGEPPKRPGRGEFLKRFPGIRAFDVGTFSRYRVYLAAPLFSEAERSFNLALATRLRDNLFEVYLPQEAGDDSDTRQESEQQQIYVKNLRDLAASDNVVAVIDGADADSGTAWEMGWASAHKKPVIALRTDFRRAGSHEHVNLMLEQSATVVTTADQLLTAICSPLLPGPDA